MAAKSSTIGRFGYRIVAPEKGGRLFTPYINIIPKDYYSQDDDGWPLLSPQLTEPEVDGYIQACKDDLDQMGKRAKRALRRAHKRMLEINDE